MQPASTFLVQNTLTQSLASGLVTGNQIIDVILSLCISLLITRLFSQLGMISPWDWIASFRRSYRIQIKTTELMTKFGNWSSIPTHYNNPKLIKAIRYYLQRTGLPGSQTEEIFLGTSSLHSNAKKNNHYYRESSRKITGIPNGSVQLSSPYTDIWLSFQFNSKGRDGKIEQLDQQITLETYTGLHRLHEFLKQCYQEWIEEEYGREKDQDQRYFLTHLTPKNMEMEYKVYPLTTQTSFTDIFFSDKGHLISLIDRFEQGKLSTPKLSLFLYGPPGTGKTSIIRALSTYTGSSTLN